MNNAKYFQGMEIKCNKANANTGKPDGKRRVVIDCETTPDNQPLRIRGEK